MTSAPLEKWRAPGLGVIPREELVDIRSVSIKEGTSAEVCMKGYLEQIKNPYCFLCDGIPVKLTFAGEEHTLQERLGKYFASLEWNQREELCRMPEEHDQRGSGK